jgi:hypothetical protein
MAAERINSAGMVTGQTGLAIEEADGKIVITLGTTRAQVDPVDFARLTAGLPSAAGVCHCTHNPGLMELMGISLDKPHHGDLRDLYSGSHRLSDLAAADPDGEVSDR